MGYWVQDTPPEKRTELFVKDMNELYNAYISRRSS